MHRIIREVVGPIAQRIGSPYSRTVAWYRHYYEKLPIMPNTIFYESRDGKSINDSPYAIFLYLLENPKFENYIHIWSYQESPEIHYIMDQFSKFSNVIFVERNTKEYVKWLAQAEYLFNNATFQPYFTAKEQQTYVNTWHGTPLKKMGFDIPGKQSGSQNIVRNFFHSDFLISPNSHTTKMYLDSYRLRGGYPGKVIETGYPRIDLMFKDNSEKLVNLFSHFKLTYDKHKALLLYSPTWKGTQITNTTDNVNQIAKEMAYVRDKVGHKYNVLIKVHPYVYNKAKENAALKPYLVPDICDTNELMSLVDILVSDYSSIFFDYLVTKKPILFYMWDDDIYNDERGQYFSEDSLPGKISYTVFELVDNILKISSTDEHVSSNYNSYVHQFVRYEDGKVCQRVVDVVFNNKNSVTSGEIIESKASKKRKILFYPGGMLNNGITTSAINLLHNIDYDQNEVYVLLGGINSQIKSDNIDRLPQQVHYVFRFGRPNFSLYEIYIDRIIHFFGANGLLKKLYPNSTYQREAKRLFGKLQFDDTVDFSGYSLYQTKLILASSGKKLCFFHSDILSDSQRVVNGKKPHKINLRGMFSVYDRYDELLSVSESTNKINKHNLERYADSEKFKVCINTIEPEKILHDSKDNEILERKETRLEISNTLSEINTTNKVAIYNKMPNYTASLLMDLNAEQSIRQIATYRNENGEKFAKVLADNIYIGWVNSKYLVNASKDAIQYSDDDIYGSINATENTILYSAPVGEKESYPIINSIIIRNMYVHITKIASTENHGSYGLITYGLKKIGWVHLGTIKRSKYLNRTGNLLFKLLFNKLLAPIVVWNNQKKYKEIIEILSQKKEIKLQEVDYYAKIRYESQLVGELIKNTQQQKFNQKNVTPTIKEGAIVNVVKIQLLNDKSYAFITDEETNGWVFASSLEKITDLSIPVFESNINLKITSTKEIGCLSTDSLLGIKRKKLINGEVKVLVTDGKKSEWCDEKSVQYDYSEGVFNADGDFIAYPSENTLSFVTMGRLSPEKNQSMIINAFSLFLKKQSSAKLYIIGSGVMGEQLVQLAKKLNLMNSIVFVGQLSNPFRFMERCQVFLLSSKYEGQPMVLLEAMTLGMKIVSTDIPACRTVLENGKYGILTENNTPEGLAKGMEEVSNSTVKFKKFDPYDYNKMAVKQFYARL